MARRDPIASYWSLPPGDVLEKLGSTERGLTSEEATERLRLFGRNELRKERSLSRLKIFARQFSSPLWLLLLFAAIVAAITGELTDSAIVIAILFASG